MEKTITHSTKSNMSYMLAVALGQSFWGLSYLFTRVGLLHSSTYLLLSMRFTLALLISSLLIFLKKAHFSFKGKNLKYITIFTIAQPLYYFFESQGILYTNSAFAGVMLSLAPIASIALAKITTKENPSLRQILFCLLPITGVIMITLSNSQIGAIQPIGVVFLLITCVCAAILTVYNKKASLDFSPFERTYTTMLMNCIVYTSLAIYSVKGNIFQYLEPLHSQDFLFSLLALVCLCSLIANTLVNYGANQLSTAQFSIFFSLSTIISMVAGVFILHEPMTWISLLGSILIIVGIWKVNTCQ